MNFFKVTDARSHATQVEGGKNSEFMKLAEPHLDGLYATAMRLSRSPVEAEELVQEAMTKAYLKLSTFEPGTNFKAWIFKILVNSFLSGRRAAKRAPVALEGDLVPAMPRVDQQELGTQWPMASETLEDELKRAVDELPELFRAPFLLATLGGLAYAEIAEALRIPVGTVMSRVHRARMRLRNELDGYGRSRGLVAHAPARQAVA